MRGFAPQPALRPGQRPPSVVKLRHRLDDGAGTTLYVAAFPLAAVGVRLVHLEAGEPLVRWCRRTGAAHAIAGGFFVRPGNAPLGELRIDGARVESVPFDAPWDGVRACVYVEPGAVTIARRPELPAEPAGDLLQAGPLLVRDGESVVTGRDDEGFTAGAHQFDSDISDGRYPRCALALCDDQLLAVTCDGRHRDDAGLTLGELAAALVGLGARSALNLDGGGSASLVCRGRLVNRPREQHGIDLLDGRPIATALVFDPR
jgi:phosphodiester glycosidase